MKDHLKHVLNLKNPLISHQGEAPDLGQIYIPIINNHLKHVLKLKKPLIFQGEAPDLGHGWSGAVPHHYLDLLPRHPRRHRGLRRHLRGQLRQRQEMAPRDRPELRRGQQVEEHLFFSKKTEILAKFEIFSE